MDYRLTRDRGPIDDNTFVVMPFGNQEFTNDQGKHVEYDFDEQYHDVFAPLIEEAGLTPVRTDSLYDGGDTVLDNVWARLQEAQIVLVDLTGSSRNVMIEFAWAYLLNKKIIPLTQCVRDVPSDLPGLRYITYSPGWRDMERMKTELRMRLGILKAEASAELKLEPMTTSSVRPVSARVVSTTREHVVVEAEKGQYGVLGQADVDLTRMVADMSRQFSIGDVLNGAFETIDGITKYTLVAGRTNPWHALLAEFPQGHVFTGKVVNIIDGVGAFVRVSHGVNGLVPISALRGIPAVEIGAELTVGVVRIDAAKRRIQLAPTGCGTEKAHITPKAGGPVPKVGERFDGEITRAVPEQGHSGGFALVKLPGYPGTAMLHCTQMTSEVRADLNREQLEIGELLLVEVTAVDGKGRIWVRDLEEEVGVRSDSPAEAA
jgi:small subunit ribosomal protein S1